ncbi:TMM74 protein, partial [Polypterus senegalus]
MASLELVCLNKENNLPDAKHDSDWVVSALYSYKERGVACGEQQCHSALRAAVGDGALTSAPRTATSKGAPPQPLGRDTRACCCEHELEETAFTYVDENVNLQLAGSHLAPKSHYEQVDPSRPHEIQQEAPPDLSLMSDDETSSEASGKSVDYGFISAVTFLVTGISLVVISYAVPRDVNVNPDSVSAREMERLENESARVGAHLDRCVIAGLCLLTLGGVVLSTLLMISMWKGEIYRRKALAYSKESAKLYGSIHFHMDSSSHGATSQTCIVEEDAVTVE